MQPEYTLVNAVQEVETASHNIINLSNYKWSTQVYIVRKAYQTKKE